MILLNKTHYKFNWDFPTSLLNSLNTSLKLRYAPYNILKLYVLLVWMLKQGLPKSLLSFELWENLHWYRPAIQASEEPELLKHSFAFFRGEELTRSICRCFPLDYREDENGKTWQL